MQKDSPICMQISPMAQVALLHTEMNSGFRLVPRIGMNSAGHTHAHTHTESQGEEKGRTIDNIRSMIDW